MKRSEKAQVGLLGLMLDLYDAIPDLKPEMAEFGKELVTAMSAFADVDFPGVCTTRDQVDEVVARFEAEGRDLIIVVLLTYAPSHIALPALRRTSLPILVFNTQQLRAVAQDTLSYETTKNHGMHGVQDLANVLLRTEVPFQLVTGHYADDTTLAEVKSWCDAARTARFVRRMRIGQVGYAMEGMGDFGLDETAFLGQVGVEIHHIAQKNIAERAQAAPADDIAQQMAFDREHFQFDEGIMEVEHEANSRIEWALRSILAEGGMHGFAPHFVAIGEEGWLDTLPFLASSKLIAEGFGFGGEGDVTSASAVAMMHEMAGAASFTEMFTMDFSGNSTLMMHMGEGNWRMARENEPVHLLPSDLGLTPVRVRALLLAYGLAPGEATLVSLTTGPGGKARFVVTEGEVLDFPYVADLARPHHKFSPHGDLSDFLTRYSLAGGSHHQALAYGRWAGTVEKVAALLGVECIHV
ncbi:MAG: hypothetical protein GX620_09705 [Chloroflexi bacterium]|nr:hypothetical protein [Chloroflexota bacterium]